MRDTVIPTTTSRNTGVIHSLARAITRTRTVDEIYATALDALADGLGVRRSSILLFDPDGVMRFKASRGISEAYRRAVEGHTPWAPGTRNAEPFVVHDVSLDPSLGTYLPTIQAELIAGMAFIPLLSNDEVIGKFMLYFDAPRILDEDELLLASTIAAQVAFAVDRTRTEAQARRSGERLRFALDAALMGTWDWNLVTNEVVWSDNLERIHGLPPGTFDGSFSSYEREIHPEDRPRVLASAARAIADGTPHDVEYRIVAPDGRIRWCEGKGRVEFVDGQPVRMSGVCVIVTRRKEAELARLAAAEEANRLKDEFLATLSHELRTPLNAILGWVQIVQQEAPGQDRARQALEVIGRNARLQAQLIEDILDVSRIIAGKLQVERAPLALAPLLEGVVTALSPAAAAKQLTVRAEVPPALPPVEGDAKRLTQVLTNVLANAVKFTPERGSIDVRCTVHGDRMQVTVTDSGVGIAPEFMPFVFDRFRQGDSRSTRQHGGLGLGLAIARYLVEQHGGRISAASEGVGRGTTVVIELPTALPHAGAPAPGGAARGTTGHLAGRVVMVVDDQDDSRDMLAVLMERQGAEVVRCGSTGSALEQLSQVPVDLLIADIGMPEADGFELMRRVRAGGLRTPAVAVTAYARPEDRQRTADAGFDAYCAKPIDVEQLLTTIGALIPPIANRQS